MAFPYSFRLLGLAILCCCMLLVPSCHDADQIATPRVIDTLVFRLHVDTIRVRPEVTDDSGGMLGVQTGDDSQVLLTISSAGGRSVAADVTMQGSLMDDGVAVRSIRLMVRPTFLESSDSSIDVPLENTMVSIEFVRSATVVRSSRDSTDDIVLIRRSRTGIRDSAFHRYITTTHNGRTSYTDTTLVGFPVFREGDTARTRQVLIWTVKREVGRQTIDSTFVVSTNPSSYFAPKCLVRDNRANQSTKIRLYANRSHLPVVCHPYFPDGITIGLRATTPSRRRASAP